MMTKQKLTAFCLMASIMFLSANPASAQDWARKMFTKYVHDFGTVTKEERPVYKFEVKNIYNETINIKNVFSSCGCTSVSVSKNSLKTWETAEIICRYNTHLFDGFKQATVTVRFDAPYSGEVQLIVRGNIVQGMNFSTKQLEFGEALPENFPTRTVQVSKNTGDFRITDVTSTYDHIGVRVKEKARYSTQTVYEMETYIKPSAPLGLASGELMVHGEFGGQKLAMPVSFNAKVISPLRLSPEVLTLSPVRPGEKKTQKIIAKSNQPFRIVDVTCTTDSFRVRADTEKKKVHLVEVVYTGNEPPGRHEWELDFKTDLSDSSAGVIKAIIDVVPEKTEVSDKEPRSEDKDTE